jgi:hypothetical protein
MGWIGGIISSGGKKALSRSKRTAAKSLSPESFPEDFGERVE